MDNLTIGYIERKTTVFVNEYAINKKFMDMCTSFARTISFSVTKKNDLETCLNSAVTEGCDYLYLNAFHFLLSAFIAREQLGIHLPFILKLHAIEPWFLDYIHLLPFLRNTDIVYSPSLYGCRAFRRITDKLTVFHIPNAIDYEHIEKNVRTLSKTQPPIPTIVFLGRLTPSKRVEPLIMCMPKVLQEVPDAQLRIIGPLSGERLSDTPESPYVDFLKKQVWQQGLSEHVHFEGIQIGNEKYRSLALSTVFVNPTVAKEESFPLVNLEAMACGLPVITTEWAGNSELVQDGSNGFLIRLCVNKTGSNIIDADLLAQKIITVLQDEALRNHMSQAARDTAQQYTYTIVFPQLVRHLQKKQMNGESSDWSIYHDKTIFDFIDQFNPDVLFFLHYARAYFNTPYGLLYQRVRHEQGIGLSPHMKRLRLSNAPHGDVLADKVRKHFSQYLRSK